MRPTTLNTQQKKSLRGIAHHLDPVVAVSERGLTEGILEETERALRDHELIKIKVFGADRAVRDEVTTTLAEATSAVVLQKIGKTAVFYRRNPKANPKLSNIARYLEPSGF